MFSPAVRTSVMPACSFGSSTSTTPPHLAPLVVPGDAEIAEQLAEPLQAAQIFVPILLGEFDEQNRLRIAAQKCLDRRLEHGDVGRQPQHGAVDQLDRDRPERDDVLRRLHRFVKAAEVAGAHRAAAEQRRELQLDLGRERQRAFGADEEMRQIDVVAARHQRIEIVAADAALHFWKAPLDLAGLARGDGEQVAHQIRRHVDAGVADAAEMRARAVGQHGVDRQHVLARIAVTQRARAAGIVADHAADGGARRGRDIDRKPQPGGFQLAIELVEHDARLDHAAPAGDVEIEHAVEIMRAIDHQPVIDRLPGLRRAAAARRHRHPFRAANPDRPFGFLYGARRHHAERHDLVVRGIGGIAPTGEGVETHLAHLLGLQAAFQAGQQPYWQIILRAHLLSSSATRMISIHDAYA